MRRVLVPAVALLICLAPQVQARPLKVHISVGGYQRPTVRSLLVQRLLRPKPALSGATAVTHDTTDPDQTTTSARSVLDDLAKLGTRRSVSPCAFQALAVVDKSHWCDNGDVEGGFCVVRSSTQY